jgi:molybdate transport system substrate-binding protein
MTTPSPATLHVFCAGAVKAAMLKLVPAFERGSGTLLQLTYGTAGGLRKQIEAGAPADILIASRPALDALEKTGHLAAATLHDLGHVGVGIAVRQGSAPLDVTSPERLRTALLAAHAITYGDPAKGDSSGIHFGQVLERLGIAAQIQPKTVFAPLGLAVAEYVAQGRVELGATQASVILGAQGVCLAGLLPPELQHLTTYAIAALAGAAAPEAARAFSAYVNSPSVRERLSTMGFDTSR